MCLLQINKKDCLHCGEGHADYCEKCYQDLIGKNAVLQFQYNLLKDDFREVVQGKFNKAIEEVKKEV